MFSKLLSRSVSALFLAVALPACTHTPAGTSVKLALARKAELVRLPTVAAVPTGQVGLPMQNTDASSAPIRLDKTELLADAFSRGEFCMSAGNDDAAISAFREAVKIDPTFSDAWTKLAALYEKNGQSQEALAAFKRAKLAVR